MKTILLFVVALSGYMYSHAQSRRSSAEVFLEIADRGIFTISLEEEIIQSAKGRFRFFDVLQNRPLLSIKEGNSLLYRAPISVTPAHRMFFRFSKKEGLQVLEVFPYEANGVYLLDSWNTSRQPTPSASSAFNELAAAVKREAFDEGKVRLIRTYSQHAHFFTSEIATLLSLMVRDDEKLKLALELRSQITDPQHYHQLSEVFTFKSSGEEFLRKLSAAPAIPLQQSISREDFTKLLQSVKAESFDDSRILLLQAGLRHQRLLTDQVGEVVPLLSDERKALSFVMEMYPRVKDPQRYYTLKDRFKFLSHRNEFMAFLNRQ